MNLIRPFHLARLLTFALFAWPSFSWALEHWFIPVEKEIKTIIVTNPTATSQMLWVSRPVDGTAESLQEISREIGPHQRLEIPLTDWRTVSFLHLKAANSNLAVQVITPSAQPITWPAKAYAAYRDFSFHERSVVITNLTPFTQTFSSDQSSFSLAGFSSYRMKAAVGNFHIQSSGRFMAMTVTPQVQALKADSEPVELTPPAEGSFFLLSNQQKNQSYVVQLTTPELISQARQQIENPTSPMGHILIAQVGKNSGGFNRNFSESRRTPWSWHIEKTLRFADLASQECDGSPEMLEELALPWIEKSGLICFWNYQIVRELNPEDLNH